MAERFSKNKIADIQNRDVFVDANVIIYWNWAIAGSKQLEIDYSSIYQELIKQKNKLFVDFLVISEVVNKMMRERHNAKILLEQKSNKNFRLSYKQFRNSNEGQQILDNIYTILKTQIEDFNIVGKSFSEDDIINFLNVDNLDFNDKGILQMCQENNFVLLTNDEDYKNSDIDILTCNRQILN